MSYFNWQTSRIKPATKPYNRLSPNLVLIGIELGKRFGGAGIGGYASWVRLTPKGSVSTHGYGAAQDWGSWPSRKACEQAMRWLIDNHKILHVQMIGDYKLDRIWKVDRYPGQHPDTWWRPYSLPAGTWIHIETGPIGQGWDDTTPIGERLGQPDPPIIVDKFTQPKPTLRMVNKVVPAFEQAATRYLQSVIGATVDGDFGPQTDRLVRAFQKAHSLKIDGIVGSKQTWPAIDKAAP